MSLLEAEEVSFPDTSDSPSCLTCGRTLHYGGRGRKPKYCDDHKPRSSKSTGTRRVGGTVTASKASDAVAKILLILTAFTAHSQCKKYGIMDEHIEEQLTMTDEEADAIAAPISRWSMKSKTGAKILGPIVENEDLIDAGVALWEYNRRTSQLLKELKGAINVANRTTASQKAEAGVTIPKVNGFVPQSVGHSLI